MRALLLSIPGFHPKLVPVRHGLKVGDTLPAAGRRDRSTLESEPSAGPVPGCARRREFLCVPLMGTEPILAQSDKLNAGFRSRLLSHSSWCCSSICLRPRVIYPP